MSLTRFGDNIYALRFLTLFNMRFDRWRAHRHGIIDSEGNKIRDAETSQEKGSWTLLHRVVARLKKTLGVLPGGRSIIATLATSLMLLKESEGDENWPVEEPFLEALVMGAGDGPGGKTTGAFVRGGLNRLFGSAPKSTESIIDWNERRRKELKIADHLRRSGLGESLGLIEDLALITEDEDRLDELVMLIFNSRSRD